MANTKLLDREIHNLAAAKARRMTLYVAVVIKTPADKLAQIPRLPRPRSRRLGYKLVRCVANGVGSGAIAFKLVYEDKTIDNNRQRRELRSAVPLDLIEPLRAKGRGCPRL